MARYPIPERYKTIEDYIKYLGKNTQVGYRANLNNFFRFLNIKPDEYLNLGRDYEKDIQDFAYSIRSRPPKTQNSYISVLRGFFEHYDIDIKSKIWRQIRRRNHIIGNKPISEDFIPNNENLRKILNHCKSAKDKSLFLFVATTGMRIDEVLNLTFDDVDMENRHVTVRAFDMKGGNFNTKTGVKRHTFFTEETKEALESWLKEREKFFTNGYRKSKFIRDQMEKKGYTFIKSKERHRYNVWVPYRDGKEVSIEQIMKLDNRIFPFNYANALEMWNSILEKAGPPYNEKDKNPQLKNPRYRCRIHALRKFWFTQMESSGANKQHLDTIGGHDSELNGIYARFPVDTLKDTYDNFSSCLSIFTELEKVKGEVQSQLDMQETTISSLVHKNNEIEKLNGQLVDNIRYLEHRVEDMIDNREREEEQAEIQEKETKEYTERFAKENPEEFAEVLKYVKLLKKLGLKAI